MKRPLAAAAAFVAVAFATLGLSGAPAPAADVRPSTPKTAAGIEAVNRGDYKAAFALFHGEAARGVPEAQFELGMLYALGKGVERDYISAWKWTEIAARQNEPYADFIRDEVAANMNGGEIGTARRQANDWMRANGFGAALPALERR
jgi:hypothetical protein